MSKAGLYSKLRTVYSGWFLLLNLVILLVYYVAVEEIRAFQQFGMSFSTAPAYLMISLVVSSSVLMTIAVYTILQSRKGKRPLGYGGAVSSCATTLVGGFVSGCGCQGALLYSGMAIVAGSGGAYAANALFSEHIGLILAALTIFNIAFIVYSLGRLPGGRAR